MLQATQQALADNQAGDTDYQPCTSKFDFVQQGRAAYTAAEPRMWPTWWHSSER